LKKKEFKLRLKSKKRRLLSILKVKKLILKSNLRKKEFKEKKSTLLGSLNKNSLDLKKKEKKSGKDFKESRS
jgi:hypothetical protein